jgi:hypothetical protein
MRHRGWLVSVLALVVFFWLIELAITLMFWRQGSADLLARWAQFGDAFGMVNSLFSGVALLGAIAALAMQRSDMEDSAAAQREAALSQTQQARIAALTAALESKYSILTHLRERLDKGGTDFALTGGRPVDVTALADQVTREFIQVNDLLDAELKLLMPNYHPEAIAWRHIARDKPAKPPA